MKIKCSLHARPNKIKSVKCVLAVHFYCAQSSNVRADNHLNVSYFSHAYVITQKVHAEKKQMVTDGQGWGRWFGEPGEMHFCNSVKIKLFDNQLKKKHRDSEMTWFLRNV